jgi:hypothetical protein
MNTKIEQIRELNHGSIYQTSDFQIITIQGN